MNSTSYYSCSTFNFVGLSSNSVSHEYWSAARDTSLVSSAITLCFILIGVPSNLLILVSILRQRLYREPTYILLLNLAVADLLMCLLYMPFTVVSGFAGEFLFGSTDIVLCKMCQFTGFTCLALGILTIHILSLLSVDRFLFFKYPLKYHTMVTFKRSIVTCTGTWVLCVLLSLPPLFGFGNFYYENSFSACIVMFYGGSNTMKNEHYTIFVACELSLPLCVLIVTNIWMLHIIRVQMRKVSGIKMTLKDGVSLGSIVQEKLRSHHSIQQQLQLFKVFGAILISNLLTWGPYFIHVLIGSVVGPSPGAVNLIIFIIITSFAVVHPIIEASLIPEFKRYLTRLIRKLLCLCSLEKSYNHCNLPSVECCNLPSIECCNLPSIECCNLPSIECCNLPSIECCRCRCSLKCFDLLDAALISQSEVKLIE